MKKFNLTCCFFLPLIISNVAIAQDVALYRVAPHCLFLKSDENLYTDNLIYYNSGWSIVNIESIQGFSIDKNQSRDENGKQYLNLNIYSGTVEYSSRSPMRIKLYFDKMPDTINYYLHLTRFTPGSTINATIPTTLKKKINVNIAGKGEPTLNGDSGMIWPPVQSYDITEIVFPNSN